MIAPPPPPPAQLAAFLDIHAPWSPAPLCPELYAFHARSLVAVWEAAELLAAGVLPAPFWAYPWAAGAAIARVLLDDPSIVRGLSVLDVGAGGGIASIAAAYCGAKRVVANDVDEWALQTTRIAAERQGLSVQTLLGDLTREVASAEGFDVVLCGDLLYERSEAEGQRALLRHASSHGATILAGDAGRTYFLPEGMRLVREISMTVPRDLEGVDTRVARVYEQRHERDLTTESHNGISR
ncbi:MAG: 50S ribosomal protein L11 methyltransferase [Longimicrobiales bacterium]